MTNKKEDTMTAKPQANTLDEILAIGVPYMNEEWAQYPHEAQHMLKGFYSTDGFKQAKEQLLAEVLDMIPEELDLNDSKLTDRQAKSRRNYNKGLRDTADAIKERFK